MLTLEAFSEDNRTKTIGDSMYRICKSPYHEVWYILELYTLPAPKYSFGMRRAHFSHNLIDVIDAFNKISKEREILDSIEYEEYYADK